MFLSVTSAPETTVPPESVIQSGRAMRFFTSQSECVGTMRVFATVAVTSVRPLPSERVAMRCTTSSGICHAW
jgi:hypothetical protein